MKALFQQIIPSLRMLFVLTLLTGVAYPLAITGVSWAAFRGNATGSVIESNGNAVGSRLIGQPFSDPKYFWGRPSALSPAFNAGTSSGSNLGPNNPAQFEAVAARIEALRAADPGNDKPVPADLVTASGSGLDPHISPAAAEYQVVRVARERGLGEDAIRQLVLKFTEGRSLGFLGEPRVNVLELNLSLDAGAEEIK